jgi:hypothetical protein
MVLAMKNHGRNGIRNIQWGDGRIIAIEASCLMGVPTNHLRLDNFSIEIFGFGDPPF